MPEAALAGNKWLLGQQVPVLALGLPDVFIDHGDPATLLAMQGLDAPGIQASVARWQAGLK